MTETNPLTDHIALLRRQVQQLRDQADRYEQAIALLEDAGGGAPPTRKGGRASRARPPQAGQPAGRTRTRIQEYLAKHPAATASEVAKAAGKGLATVHYHLKALRT